MRDPRAIPAGKGGGDWEAGMIWCGGESTRIFSSKNRTGCKALKIFQTSLIDQETVRIERHHIL